MSIKLKTKLHFFSSLGVSVFEVKGSLSKWLWQSLGPWQLLGAAIALMLAALKVCQNPAKIDPLLIYFMVISISVFSLRSLHKAWGLLLAKQYTLTTLLKVQMNIQRKTVPEKNQNRSHWKRLLEVIWPIMLLLSSLFTGKMQTACGYVKNVS